MFVYTHTHPHTHTQTHTHTHTHLYTHTHKHTHTHSHTHKGGHAIFSTSELALFIWAAAKLRMRPVLVDTRLEAALVERVTRCAVVALSLSLSLGSFSFYI